MSCHHNSTGAGGPLVNNKGYENESPNGASLGINGATSAPVVSRSYLQFEQDGSSSENRRAEEPPMEEVALHNMAMTTREEIRRLCPCEEEGRTCRCSTNNGLKNEAEPWNKCKMIALGIVTALVGVWLVVYITLSQSKVV